MSSKSEVTERIVQLMQLVIASSVMTNERIARSLGMNVVDMQAFGFIQRHGGPMTAGEVSQQTELPTSTTTRVLDRLEGKGLVRREPDPSDRRKTWVHAVPLDRPEVGAAYASIVRQMEEVHAGFTVAELKTVIRYLDAIKDVR